MKILFIISGNKVKTCLKNPNNSKNQVIRHAPKCKDQDGLIDNIVKQVVDKKCKIEFIDYFAHISKNINLAKELSPRLDQIAYTGVINRNSNVESISNDIILVPLGWTLNTAINSFRTISLETNIAFQL